MISLDDIRAAMMATDGKTDPAVIAAFLPPKARRVFGAELCPVTIGSIILLEATESPLIGDGWATMTDGQIAQSQVILSNGREASQLVANGKIAEARLSGKPEPSEREAGLMIMRHHIEEAFGTAISMKSSTPTAPRKPGGFPWWLTRIADAIEKYGWTVDQVLWDIPLQQLLAISAATAYNHGLDTEGETYEDRAMLAYLANMQK